MKKLEAQLPEVPTPFIRSETVCITYTLFHFKFLLIWCYRIAFSFSFFFSGGEEKKFLNFSFLKYFCNHLFKAKEMQPRNADGIVKWQCCKCKKVFEAHCGLDILNNGRCDGQW